MYIIIRDTKMIANAFILLIVVSCGVSSFGDSKSHVNV